MRRLTLCTAVAPVLAAGAVAMGQTRITTVDEYAKVMKSNAQIGGAMNTALGSAGYADARTLLVALRQNFVRLQGFWTLRKRDDASRIVQDGLTRIDALDEMLGMASVDAIAVQTAAEEFGPIVCRACHKLHREGDAQTGFRFKPGVF